MAEDSTPNIPTPPPPSRYGNNSNAAKEVAPAAPLSRVTKPVTTGHKRKETLGTKFRSSFAGDDAKTVVQYLVVDVIAPNIKDLLFKMLTEAGRRMLYGGGVTPTVGGYSAARPAGSSGYARVFQASTPGAPAAPTQPTQAERVTQDYSRIVIESKGQAELVLDALGALIDEYGSCTVADFYASVSITPTHQDTTIGWTSLANASISHIPEGYLINMPRAVALNRN